MFSVFIFQPTLKLSSKVAADNEISLLARVSTPSKATHKTWSLQAAEHQDGGSKEDGDKKVEAPCVKFMPLEGGVASPRLKSSEEEAPTIHKVSLSGTQPDAAQPQLNLSLDTSETSVRSTDTTLEFFDAPLSAEQEGEEDGAAAAIDEEAVTINIAAQAEKDEPEKTSTSEETPLITSEVERGDEEEAAKQEEPSEEVMETGPEQESTTVPSEPMDEQDPDLSTKQDATLAGQGAAAEDVQGDSTMWCSDTRCSFDEKPDLT